MKTHIKIKLSLASILLAFNVFASGELHLEHANTDISDTASLQNGAKTFYELLLWLSCYKLYALQSRC